MQVLLLVGSQGMSLPAVMQSAVALRWAPSHHGTGPEKTLQKHWDHTDTKCKNNLTEDLKAHGEGSLLKIGTLASNKKVAVWAHAAFPGVQQQAAENQAKSTQHAAKKAALGAQAAASAEPTSTGAFDLQLPPVTRPVPQRHACNLVDVFCGQA